MEERNTVKLKKEEFAVKENIKKLLGKGKASRVIIEYTPVGEKIIISTHKPGLVIGRKGEKISELTGVMKNTFKLTNPHIEIEEIMEPELDAQIMADDIAMGLEKFGPLKFKILAYGTLERIMKSGALGAEIRLNGKLPSARATTWRFAKGYLKKTGESSKLVDQAHARAETKPGTIGIKVSILSPYTPMTDRVKVDDELIKRLKEKDPEEEQKIKKKKTKENKE